MSYIKAPSNITLVEYKFAKKNEKKRISFLKKLFIHCSFFKIGKNVNKLNGTDVIKILSNDYSGSVSSDCNNENIINVLEILNIRQKDIERQVKCKLYSLIGICALPFYSYHKFRYYDAKTKLIILPFFSIAGMYLGLFFGNMITGRFSDYKRSKFLGTLPAHVFLRE
ncbi:conserved protein, unknown function [Hepatocystis sp. ex Piliocolobus tephrosceles]|nr:conserved protein, unknown function [Hepatocystis sp. ex Piliocolobus tephrosceles]